jgi:hypothetical protein
VQYDRRLPHAGCCTSRNTQDEPAPAANAPPGYTSSNCLIQIRPPQPSSSGTRHSRVRAMGLALSPTEPNLMGVACGDNYVRLYDRRKLSLHAPATAGVHACTPWVAMFTPPHVGCAQSTSADADFETAVPDYHATHVAFSPDGGALLASFHSDHVYAFDVQTGIAESSTSSTTTAAAEDTATAVSAYMLPELSRQQLDESATASYMQVDTAAEVYAAVADLQAQHRAARTALDERDFTKVTTILSRALAAAHFLLLTLQQLQRSGTAIDDELWPPLDSALLAQLYCLRAEALLLRKWRGDSYLAVLDCGRAHSLCPDSHDVATQFIDALAADGRRDAAKEIARSFIAAHPQHSSSMQRYLSSSSGSDSAAAADSSAASADATAGDSGASSSSAQPEHQAADSTSAMDTDADAADNSAAAAGLIAELADTAAAAFAEGAAVGAAAAVADAAAAADTAAGGTDAAGAGRTGRRGVQVQLPSVRLTRRLSDGSHLYVRVDTVTSAPLDGTTATTVGTAADEADAATDAAAAAADTGTADVCSGTGGEDANTNDDNDMDTSDDSSDSGDTLSTQQQRLAVQWRELLTSVTSSSAGAALHTATSSRRSTATAAATAALPPACTSALLQRYIGARNVATDIKEAAFFGANHVVAGSDDGRVFIWQRSDGQLVHAIKADEDIVNW